LRRDASTRAEPAVVQALTDSVVFTRWYSAMDNRREAISLRHRGYVAAGLIEPSPFGTYSDPYDDLPTTIVAALFRRGACLSTLRVSIWSPDTDGPALPCEKIYPEVASFKARATGPVAEISRLAIDPAITITRYRSRIYAASIRSAILACLALDVQHLLIATQMKWRHFYEQAFDFEAVGPPQLYPPGNVPVVLLKRDIDEILLKRMASNLFFKIDEGELAELRTLLPPLIVAGGAAD